MGPERREGMEKERVEVRTRPRPPLPASQQRAVDEFWRRRQEEIEATVDFRERMLPMARLKKVIRGAAEEDDGMMISADTPTFLSKLCELFVQELTVRAWACAHSHNRRIILGSDIAEAVASTESFDFLLPVLLDHLHEVAQAGRAAPPATARVVTRKRHRPEPGPRRAVRRIPSRVVLPVSPATPAPPSKVRYVPFPFPCVLPEGATPSVDELMLPAQPMNYTTRGCVFFSNGNSSSGYTSEGAEMVRSPPLAGSATRLQPSCVPPAPYYFYSYPAMDDNIDAIAVGNTDPSGITEEIPAGNADGNTDLGQQQKLSETVGARRESVVVQQSSDVQEDGAAGGSGGIENDSPLYMLLDEVLLDEDLLFPDAGMFPAVRAPLDSEDFVIDQDVLDDVFADQSSSTSSN